MLDLAYDWVARVVYYAVRTTNNQLELYIIPVLDKESHGRLFPYLDHTLTPTTTLQLTMDPTAGYAGHSYPILTNYQIKLLYVNIFPIQAPVLDPV